LQVRAIGLAGGQADVTGVRGQGHRRDGFDRCALPPAASGHEAVRTVATTVWPAGASHGDDGVAGVDRALEGVRCLRPPSRRETWATPSRAATHGIRSLPKVVDGPNTWL
jgi:hypothetical protein